VLSLHLTDKDRARAGDKKLLLLTWSKQTLTAKLYGKSGCEVKNKTLVKKFCFTLTAKLYGKSGCEVKNKTLGKKFYCACWSSKWLDILRL